MAIKSGYNNPITPKFESADSPTAKKLSHNISKDSPKAKRFQTTGDHNEIRLVPYGPRSTRMYFLDSAGNNPCKEDYDLALTIFSRKKLVDMTIEKDGCIGVKMSQDETWKWLSTRTVF